MKQSIAIALGVFPGCGDKTATPADGSVTERSLSPQNNKKNKKSKELEYDDEEVVVDGDDEEEEVGSFLNKRTPSLAIRRNL